MDRYRHYSLGIVLGIDAGAYRAITFRTQGSDLVRESGNVQIFIRDYFSDELSIQLVVDRQEGVTYALDDVPATLRHIFADVFEKSSQDVYEALRGHHFPWRVSPEEYRVAGLGTLQITRYGEEAREWSGHVGHFPFRVIEKKEDHSVAFLDLSRGLFPRLAHSEAARLSFCGRNLEEVLENLLLWRRTFIKTAALLSSTPKNEGGAVLFWTDWVKRGDLLG